MPRSVNQRVFLKESHVCRAKDHRQRASIQIADVIQPEHSAAFCSTRDKGQMPNTVDTFGCGRTLCRVLRQTGIDPNPGSVFELMDFPLSADHNATEQPGRKSVLRIGSRERHVRFYVIFKFEHCHSPSGQGHLILPSSSGHPC